MRKTIFTIALLVAVQAFSGCSAIGSASDDSNKSQNLSLAALGLVAAQLKINGTWSDTSDSNQPYTITSANYVTNTYLGTGTKTDYTMQILSYDNNAGIIRQSGLQLNFAGFPTITTSANTVYQRTQFTMTDSNTFYYCITVSNKASVSALDADTTSYTFTSATGATCNGFTWSKMTRR